MTILVHNYIGIDDETLRLAEAEADEIFRQAGVEVGWQLCYPASNLPENDCPEDSPSTPYLRFVPRFRSVKGQVPADSMGYSTGDMMTVSWAEAENVARSGAGPVSEVLGLIIVHEFGHLLLGGAHSLSGIMRARWGSNDWQLAHQGRLVFLPSEAEHLRQELRNRSQTAMAEGRRQ